MRSGFPLDWPVAFGANTNAPARSVAADKLITIRCFMMKPRVCVWPGWSVRGVSGPVNQERTRNPCWLWLCWHHLPLSSSAVVESASAGGQATIAYGSLCGGLHAHQDFRHLDRRRVSDRGCACPDGDERPAGRERSSVRRRNDSVHSEHQLHYGLLWLSALGNAVSDRRPLCRPDSAGLRV